MSEPAQAAQSLQEIQRQIERLQEDATSSAEGAQNAKVQLDSLNRTLRAIRQQAASQGQTLSQLRKTLGSIAVQQYTTGGLGQNLELLFSSNPSLYLSTAGSLDALARRKSIQLQKFAAAAQRLKATTLTVNDKLSLVEATRTRLISQNAQVRAKLVAVEKILSRLKKSDRLRLAALTRAANEKSQRSSLVFAKSALKVSVKSSARAAVAIRFALAQIGDRYVFGSAGLVTWDCSGLTLRAFQQAGVSLPHSSAAQANYGKRVPFNQVRPGDLVFFGNPISHSAIYLGGGRMVNAPRTGARVRVDSFGAFFGSKRFVTARRL
ncbi:MAG: C40 family peptidase [Actinobacteria bacterium]|nr:C40 family peptidase [Actinomycetota bacterium]